MPNTNYDWMTPAPPPGVEPQNDLMEMFNQFGFSDAQEPVDKFNVEQDKSNEAIKQALMNMQQGTEKRPTMDKIMSIANALAFVLDKTGKSSGARNSANEKFAENATARQGREAQRVAKLRQKFSDTFAVEDVFGKGRAKSLDATQRAQTLETNQKQTAATATNVDKQIKAGRELTPDAKAKEAARKTSEDFVAKNGWDAMISDPIQQALYIQGHPELKNSSLLETPSDKFARIQGELEKEVENSIAYKSLAQRIEDEGTPNGEAILDDYLNQQVAKKMQRRYPDMFASDEQLSAEELAWAMQPAEEMQKPQASGLKEKIMSQDKPPKKRPFINLNPKDPGKDVVMEDLTKALKWWFTASEREPFYESKDKNIRIGGL